MTKSQRHEIILEIIKSGSVETQEMLRERLLEGGIDVTQATLSRDIKELGLIKKQDRYFVPQKSTAEIPTLIRESVNSIDHAMNMVVFKCHAGMAMAACAMFDKLGYSGVVGTLAGDDTIFIVMRSEKDAAAFVKEMQSVIFSSKKGDINAQ
ncbi:MAG: hypothetical protein MSJ26_09935 [Oscillospiraceae bacterium]|nr:hypothetical protein [Oscillospiraceae bacterium]